MGLQVIENMIGSGLGGVVGDPAFLGFIVLIFFVGFVMLQAVGGGMKVLIIMGAMALASVFFPPLRYLLLIVGAAILIMAFLKFMNR
jgi:predicted branched-subunit amino acid permease